MNLMSFINVWNELTAAAVGAFQSVPRCFIFRRANSPRLSMFRMVRAC